MNLHEHEFTCRGPSLCHVVCKGVTFCTFVTGRESTDYDRSTSMVQALFCILSIYMNMNLHLVPCKYCTF